MEIVPYAGWQRCARIVNGPLELLVTLDVGPRIIHFGLIGGVNEFMVNPKTAGSVGGDTYHSYGGHRFWIAPEDPLKVDQPDNSPVDYRAEGEWAVFRSLPDKWFMQKEVWVRPNAGTGGFDVHHRIHNNGAYEAELALWGLTVMATGGQLLVPQAPYASHPASLLPARPLVLWSYTDLADVRFSLGKRVLRLQQDQGSTEPNKFGTLVTQGYVGYANRGNLFIKRFGFESGAEYPDFGCNFESFTRHDMLEVESLGPLVKVNPGGLHGHDESWYLVPEFAIPSDDDSCAAALESAAASRPLMRFQV